MQIENYTAGVPPSEGTPHYFSAVLFEGWEFWSPGPNGPSEKTVLIELSILHCVERAVITKVYLPRVH